MNYYAVAFLLRPPNLLRRGPFLERENVCNSQENGVRTRRAAIVNHSAIVNSLRVVNLLRVLFLVRRGPLGWSATKKKTQNPKIGQKYHPHIQIPPKAEDQKNNPEITRKIPTSTNVASCPSARNSGAECPRMSYLSTSPRATTTNRHLVQHLYSSLLRSCCRAYYCARVVALLSPTVEKIL